MSIQLALLLLIYPLLCCFHQFAHALHTPDDDAVHPVFENPLPHVRQHSSRVGCLVYPAAHAYGQSEFVFDLDTPVYTEFRGPFVQAVQTLLFCPPVHCALNCPAVQPVRLVVHLVHWLGAAWSR